LALISASSRAISAVRALISARVVVIQSSHSLRALSGISAFSAFCQWTPSFTS